MKRAYKLQEFVAHASNVNCLKIGKKSSRVLVTGGEDHKVNMWAIGKPNAIMTLSGHTSAVESVTYDSAEVLVVAGSASGTIKLWDLEEARIVRTLTGHRSNCVSLDFHPFGEFFASGSLDTNLKIWDIRRKDCIHTYKGHTHGVNAIKFSPDGRWVVSGGEDNVVKLWDLTAGKLMHDFRFHEGQIHCIDFHPHEYLLATGSADRTVKLWDLETFELIGSAGPETTGIRSMIFNPDGRTLLCGLHESLKVYSWEPIICHDAVDVGWSRLGDLSIHEGKLLGCSYNQSCVGVWVVDISRVGPYAAPNASRTKTLTEGKLGSGSHQLVNNLKNSAARLSMSHNTESGVKDSKNTASVTAAESHSPTQRTGMAFATKNLPASSGPSYVMTPKKNNVSRVQPVPTFQSLGRADVAPVIVPRNSPRLETITDSKKEMNNVGRMVPSMGSSKSNDIVKSGNSRDESDKIDTVNPSASLYQKQTASNEKSDKNFARTDQNFISRFDTACTNSTHFGEANPVGPGLTGASKFRRNPSVESSDNLLDRTSMHARVAPDDGSISHPEHKTTGVDLSKRVVEPGRARALVASWERRERGLATDTAVPVSTSTPSGGLDMSSFILRGSHGPPERDLLDAGENDAIEDLMQQHNTFISILQTRLTKLQVIRRFWHRNDLKGAIEAMGKMGDHSVLTDVISVLMERSNVFTLDICTVLLPLLIRMLDSEIERHITVSLETLLMLVKTFGHVIRATIVSSPTIGVDLQAEQRRERCNVCFVELEKVKQILVPLTRRHGTISKYAQELSVALQEV